MVLFVRSDPAGIVAAADLVGLGYEVLPAATVPEAQVRADRDRHLHPVVSAVFPVRSKIQSA
jgi:hypothetical protein